MRIAIAYWQGRVSPVFDVSDHLLLIDIEDGREQCRKGIQLAHRDPHERTREVSRLGVDILLCGAVSRVLETCLTDAGVTVLGFICGDIEAIFTAFLLDQLSDTRFLMPGCRRKWKRPHFRPRSKHKTAPTTAGDLPVGTPEANRTRKEPVHNDENWNHPM